MSATPATDALAHEPVTLAEVRRRGMLLAAVRGADFDTADAGRVVDALLPGWVRCGSRSGTWGNPAPLNGWTFVCRSLTSTSTSTSTTWVGFTVARTAPERSRRGPRDHREWDTLSGASRIGLVLRALNPEVSRPLIADCGPDFLNLVQERLAQAPKASRTAHLTHMADIVLGDDFADPDGQAAAARTLAGLGGYERLTGPR